MNRNAILTLLIIVLCTVFGACTSDEILQAPIETSHPTPVVSAASQHADLKKTVKLTLKITPTGVEKLQEVDAPNAMNRRDPHKMSETFYRTLDAQGKVVFERGFKLKTERYGEFGDQDGNLEKIPGPDAAPIVSIIVPVNSNARSLQLLRRDPGAARVPVGAGKIQDGIVLGEVPL